jgi:hypothetical protein
MIATATDFDFLTGAFDVHGRRLRDALDADSGWVEFAATSTATTLLDGVVNVDEMWFPDQNRFGMSLRLYDPVARTWTVRWFDGRGGGLQPPVEGRWDGGRCRFTGPDEYAGRPVLASYSWSDVTESSARWEQCFSTDGGRTWLPNWVMHYDRRREAVHHPDRPRATDDFGFLAGRWHVHHRRHTDPLGHALGGPSEVVEWDGGHVGRSYVAGAVSIDEVELAEPGQRGLTFRTYDSASAEWSIYWVNSRVGRLEPPVHGRFGGGVGTFFGAERLAGHEVRVRFVWSDISATTARWRQAFSVDGGITWDENWEMTFTRPADGRS